MGFRKTSSEVYAKAWESYRIRCREEGFIALNRYCLSIGVKVRRLYEWLRRRKISLSDFQDSCGTESFVKEDDQGYVRFHEVEILKPGEPVAKESAPQGLEARFDLPGGDTVEISGASVADLACLMRSLNAAANVGS